MTFTLGIDPRTDGLNMARRLFPQVDLRYKKDDGKADDALHMARYALTQI